MKYRWAIAPDQSLLSRPLADRLGISPLLSQCILNRGLSEPEAIRTFLNPRLKNLANPFLIPDMDVAVARLLQARERREPLVIFGDYDVDGVASTALLLEVFKRLGLRASHYLPNRMDEGYGLTRDGAENCLKQHSVSLLLAVDCGSTANATIAWLRERGVDVLVLDHHQVSDPPPNASALVNPQRAPEGESAPFAELCSAGLAFKLAHALVKRGRETGLPEAVDYDIRPLLDLVALATVADIVPLTGENRILVSSGLERLAKTQRPGLVALKEVARCTEPIGVYEVGFQLGPRLNASGRLETAEESLCLLLAPDVESALPIAHSLDSRNQERQRIEKTITEEAVGTVRSRFNPQTDYVIVEGRLLWHIGVVGIVASRVLQQFNRPTLIIGGDGDLWRGSGRSIEGFDLAAALRQCGDLLERHGGHAMAAGVTLKADNVDALRVRLNEIARKTLTTEQLQPVLKLDAKVRLADLNLTVMDELDRLKPCGQNNPAVRLAAHGLSHARPLQRLGRERQHVKMWVTDGVATHEAVWWGGGTEETLPTGRFDLAFAPQANSFNGRRTLQLRVLDWHPA